jgi:hypothetical protein
MSVADPDIVADLFFEQEQSGLGANYRHGLHRTFFTVARALLPRSGNSVAPPAELEFASGETVAIVFFENEYHAAMQARQRLGIDRIVRLDNRRLAMLWGELGAHQTLREIAAFVVASRRRGGTRSLARLGTPLLGWLVHALLRRALARATSVRIVTTNMLHPLSVGAFHAARLCGHRNVYLEHATTTSVAFRHRGYDLLAVDLPHTKSMLVGRGVDASRILLARNGAAHEPVPVPGTLRGIGLCINDLDDLEAIARVTSVVRRLGIPLSYRVHDSDRRGGLLARQARAAGVTFGSAKASRIQEFFSTVDLVIAGNSNVVADALLARVPVIYYWDGGDDFFDYYGLVEHYRVASARSPKELAELIERAREAPERGPVHRP